MVHGVVVRRTLSTITGGDSAMGSVVLFATTVNGVVDTYLDIDKHETFSSDCIENINETLDRPCFEQMGANQDKF